MADVYPQIQPELGTGQIDLLIVGRDLGREEVQKGKPFANKHPERGAGYVLDKALTDAGVRRRDLAGITNCINRRPPGNNFEAHSEAAIQRGLDDLFDLINDLQPNCVLALGNIASYALVPDWPTKKNQQRIGAAKGIRERRGYIWEGKHGGKVVTSVHPSSIQRGSWVPFRVLLAEDIGKAKKEARTPDSNWPTRKCIVPNSKAEARQHVRKLKQYDRLAADTESYRHDNHRLACCGFAGEEDEAVVFPAQYFGEFRRLLVDDEPTLIWANGQYDAYYLYSRYDIRPTVDDDTQLMWHSMYPALAGKSKQKSHRMSRKSLDFLASLYTRNWYWKNYDFANDQERYRLNAIDCCCTLEIMRKLEDEMDQLGHWDIYDHALSLVWPTVEMQDRGLVVDDDLRRTRVRKLRERYDDIHETINEMMVPLIRERRDRLEGLEIGQTTDAWNLFVQKWTCDCCRGGSKKRNSCTDCLGVEGTGSNGAILKDDLVRALRDFGVDAKLDEMTKDELRELVPPCEECDGEGKRKWLEFNVTSPSQLAAVLYEVLRVPERREGGSLATDEVALRSILAEI